MQFDARRALLGLLIAGIAGGFLLMPAVVYIGTFLSPSPITPSTTHVAPLLAEALWARAGGGSDSQLRPLNPFTIGRMAGCHILAETLNQDPAQREAQHDACMKLMPGVQAVGYVSSLHLQSTGVWQDPRVPFVQLATMTKMSDKWTRDQLVDTLAERAEFSGGLRGVDQVAQAFFDKRATELTVAEAALIAALAGDRRIDPWCDPERAAMMRRRILERMRENLAIDDAALDAANKAELGVGAPPKNHRPCKG